MSRVQSAFESKQWQARRTRFQQTKRRTWTTANQFPKLRRRFRTHRPESRTGGERAARTVVRCEDEAHGDQAEGGQKQSKVDQSQRRDEVGKLQEDRSKAVIAKAIAEATKAVEKTSVRRLRVIPPKSAKAATASYPAE